MLDRHGGRGRRLLFAVDAALVAGALVCARPRSSVPPAPAPSPATSAAALAAPAPSAAAAVCHARGPLPDPVCTPGVADPSVSAAVLCAAGYSTRSVRPPSSYTDALKRRQMVAYGLRGEAGDYEEDHLEALEDGGHPTAEGNLWPQSRLEHPGAAEKDHLETSLHREVCAGALSLAAAQDLLRGDWVAAYQQRAGTDRLAQLADGGPALSDSDDDD